MIVVKEKSQQIWDKVSERYFAQIEKLFGKLDFYNPKEISVAFSVTTCNDIADDYVKFHIWYRSHENPAGLKQLVAHEILHFCYYTYVKKKGYTKLVDNWDLAEIFNVVVLDLPEFVAITGQKDCGYQQHEKYFPYYKKLWAKSSSLDKYLQKTNEGGLIES